MSKQTATKTMAPEGDQDVWDEARLEEAMQRLKLLHIKVTVFLKINPAVHTG